jgi:hypothetical protein
VAFREDPFSSKVGAYSIDALEFQCVKEGALVIISVTDKDSDSADTKNSNANIQVCLRPMERLLDKGIHQCIGLHQCIHQVVLKTRFHGRANPSCSSSLSTFERHVQVAR